MRLPSSLSVLTVLGSLSAPGSSAPVDSEDIICHGKDCYPRVFQATDEFQIVRADQIIPKGLHVRMDFNTGLKEAKIYDGVDDRSLQAVEVFTDETTEQEPVYSPLEDAGFLKPEGQQVFKPEKVDHGAIRPSPPGPDGDAFTRDTKTILSSASSETELLPALENLEDLSHDIYWGLRLGQDGNVIHKLNKFIATTTLDQQIRSASALLLGTAIQNNPAALTAALSHFYNDQYPEGPLETVMYALIHEQFPALTVRLVYLLSELCQNEIQFTKFIRSDGVAILRELYDANNANNDAKDRLRQKISNFVLDHFLQEESLRGLTRSDLLHSSSQPGKQAAVDTDDWVIVGKDESLHVPSNEHHYNARAMLADWCEPFSMSLKYWKKGHSQGESATAAEHVEEASIALDQKLKSWGCSCSNPEQCQE